MIMSEFRKKNPNSFPHCDSLVLHYPGTCEYCDGYPDWQANRLRRGINFTGEGNPLKHPCPAEEKRPLETINKWHGNVPMDEEQKRSDQEWLRELKKLLKEDD